MIFLKCRRYYKDILSIDTLVSKCTEMLEITTRFGGKVNAGKISYRLILYPQSEINVLKSKILLTSAKVCRISIINTKLISCKINRNSTACVIFFLLDP